jgi:hypothetical protein
LIFKDLETNEFILFALSKMIDEDPARGISAPLQIQTAAEIMTH